MKKVFAIASVALFAASLTSCTGDFDCVCEDASGETVTAASYSKVRKADAEDSCDIVANAYESCELK